MLKDGSGSSGSIRARSTGSGSGGRGSVHGSCRGGVRGNDSSSSSSSSSSNWQWDRDGPAYSCRVVGDIGLSVVSGITEQHRLPSSHLPSLLSPPTDATYRSTSSAAATILLSAGREERWKERVACVAPEETAEVKRTIISDSGANLGLISHKTAAGLGLSVLSLEQPFRVQFGSTEARPFISHYVDGGPIIGRLYVLEGAAMSLSSVVMFTRNHLDVLYSGDKVAVLEDGVEVLCGTMDPKTRLYEFDLVNLLTFSRTWRPRHQRSMSAAASPPESASMGASPTSSVGATLGEQAQVEALDKWDPSYVRRRKPSARSSATPSAVRASCQTPMMGRTVGHAPDGAWCLMSRWSAMLVRRASPRMGRTSGRQARLALRPGSWRPNGLRVKAWGRTVRAQHIHRHFTLWPTGR